MLSFLLILHFKIYIFPINQKKLHAYEKTQNWKVEIIFDILDINIESVLTPQRDMG